MTTARKIGTQAIVLTLSLLLILSLGIMDVAGTNSETNTIGTRGQDPVGLIEDMTPNPAEASDVSLIDGSTVGYWTFDEGEGATTSDLSWMGNEGTIQGAV